MAVFGTGRAGRIHIPNVIASPNTTLVAIVDIPSAPALPDEIQSTIPADTVRVDASNQQAVNELLERADLDAVLIASPTGLHTEQVTMALNKNKHVFVEKPLAETLNEINACFDAAESSGCILQIGYNRRYDPAINAVKTKVDSGEIGTPTTALTVARDYPYPQAAFLKTCGGLFHDCATHDIDYMGWLLSDKPTKVMVNVPPNTDTTNLNVDHAVLSLQYTKGALATLHLSRVSSNYDQRCEVFGTQGEARMADFIEGAKTSFPQRYADAFKAELEAFVVCVKENKPALVTRQDCIIANCVAEACAVSLASGAYEPV